MKTRTGFVSNSSSSSFVIPLSHPVAQYIDDNWEGTRIEEGQFGRFTGICSGKEFENWVASDDWFDSLKDRLTDQDISPIDCLYIRESDESMNGYIEDHIDFERMKAALSFKTTENASKQLVFDFNNPGCDLEGKTLEQVISELAIYEEEYH